ncbi:hypothetical protein [Nitrosospira sp. Nsp18]|uniref:hypothetical protein n=1 Tax=Nitrosospira sp. Nsp18 TaxID=1855334 RepID=UPI00115FBE70|nr:hypothetical protein [Nitrosospira sp. Nsp18]
MNTSILDLDERLKHTEMAIGLILATLSRETGNNLRSIASRTLTLADALNLPKEVSEIISRIGEGPEDTREPGIVVLD